MALRSVRRMGQDWKSCEDGVMAVAVQLEKVLDQRAWSDLRAALDRVRAPPLLGSVFTDHNDPWHAAARAVLGCPSVNLSQGDLFWLSLAGLGGVAKLWRQAQEERRLRGSYSSAPEAMLLLMT